MLSLEGILTKMASERATLKKALTRVAACSTAPGTAAAQVTAVGASRQLLISQVRALAAPTAQATKLRSLLLAALADSLQSDRYYSGWLAQQGSQCPPKPNAELRLAQRSDERATAAKQQFLASFNPLATKLHLRTWSASKI